MSSPPPPTPAHVSPFLEEDETGLSLHFTRSELQSRMNRLNPFDLDVDYTRTMMGVLMFRPPPPRIGMVGLGGGSLAKFCHRQLPASRITVVEINPQVIALRRSFLIPDDSERFGIVEGDGAVFVASQVAAFEALLIDGFDHQGQPAALCSQAFYDDCFAALAPDGVMAVNLHQDHPDHALFAERIRRSFGGNCVEVSAPEDSNCIVFASRGAPLSPRSVQISAGLAPLDAPARRMLRPEFTRIAWCMRDLADSQAG